MAAGACGAGEAGKLPVLVQLTAAQANQLLMSARAMQKAAASEAPANPLFARPTPPADSAKLSSARHMRARSARSHMQRPPAVANKRTVASARRAATACQAMSALAGAAVPITTPRRRKARVIETTAAEVEALVEKVAQRRPELDSRPLLVFAVEGALADGCSCPCYFTASGGHKSAVVHLRPGLASGLLALLRYFQVALVAQLPTHHLVNFLNYLSAAEVRVDALYVLSESTDSAAVATSGWGSSRGRFAAAAIHDYRCVSAAPACISQPASAWHGGSGSD